MRTGNLESSETDDYLLPPVAPQLPEPSYSPISASFTAAFPVPPTNAKTVAAPSVVLSPDEMLRAYAERKKNLADAARAGRIGAPLRASVVPSITASAVTSHSGSTVNNTSGGSLGMGTGRVETVSSIHATGMRVAYNDGDGMVLPPSMSSGYPDGSPQTKPILPLSLSGKGAKGIEGGKALLGKVKSMGKKRKSMNPFAKFNPDPEASVSEGGEELEADGVDNPGEAYVAALEAEAAQAEAERQLNASHTVGDDVVGAYPYAYEQQQQQQQYYGEYEGPYYGYGYQFGEDQGGGAVYAYANGAEGGEEGQQGGHPYGY
jgi:hypothetical protein